MKTKDIRFFLITVVGFYDGQLPFLIAFLLAIISGSAISYQKLNFLRACLAFIGGQFSGLFLSKGKMVNSIITALVTIFITYFIIPKERNNEPQKLA